jgi:hypothetical protein
MRPASRREEAATAAHPTSMTRRWRRGHAEVQGRSTMPPTAGSRGGSGGVVRRSTGGGGGSEGILGRSTGVGGPAEDKSGRRL